MPDLFLQRTPTLSHDVLATKQAAGIRLPPDPTTWPPFIHQAAMEKLPDLSEFQLDIRIEHMDEPSNSCLGYITVTRKPSPSLDAAGQLRPAPQGKHVLIPILVARGELMPLDLLVTNHEGQRRVFPLTSRRLRQGMFRQDIFGDTSFGPGVNSIAESMFPSSRDGMNARGMGSGLAGGGGFGSGSGKIASLLDTLLDQVGESGRLKLAAWVSNEPMFAQNQAAAPVLELLLTPREAAPEFSLKEAASLTMPSVVQITSRGDGTYLFKRASAEAWYPLEDIINRATLLKLAEPEEVAMIDEHGAALMSGSSEADEPPPPKPELLQKATVARVPHAAGELIGLVIPNLIDADGTMLPITFFTNGSVHALASEVQGWPLTASIPSLPAGPVTGRGMFVRHDIAGHIDATVPITIQSSVHDAQGERYLAVTDGGARIQVRVQDGLKRVMAMEGMLLIPTSFKWMPLDKSKQVELKQGAPTPSIKVASTKLVQLYVGDRWAEVEGSPLQKLGGKVQGSTDEVAFTLVGLGLSPSAALEKMAESRVTQSPISFLVPDTLVPAKELYDAVMQKMAAAVPVFEGGPIDLVKTAAMLPSSESIDTLLGLGLLNADTLNAFTAAIPQLETSLSILCEMLLASRVGLQALPAPFLEKAIAGLEPTIEGCFQIRFQQSEAALGCPCDPG